MTRLTLTLLETLDELTDDELKRFVFCLSKCPPQNFKAIPKGKVHQKSREDVADEMIEAYGEEGALLVTIDILKQMNKNNPANKLEKQKRTRPDPNAVPLKKQRLANEPSQTCQPANVGNASDKGKDALAPVDIHYN